MQGAPPEPGANLRSKGGTPGDFAASQPQDFIK
jgi:hypothetical protein